jgi:uncharacterized cupin superfamily protein
MPYFTPDEFIWEEVASREGPPDRVGWISEAGGITQFGAFLEILQPGSRTSRKHWHLAEDELVYVLEGEITLVEGDSVAELVAGEAATFKAGVAVGHYLENRSPRPTRCLVFGTRATVDRITYPDDDRVCHRDRREPDDVWTDLAGQPSDRPHEG